MLPNIYSCKAIAFSDEVTFQSLRDYFSSLSFQQLESSCFLARLDERKLVYLFKFRAVVFIGFSQEEEKQEVAKIRAELVESSCIVEEDEFSIRVEEGSSAVSFNSLSFSEWDGQLIDVLAQVLARSCALSIVENEVNDVISGSESMASKMTKTPAFWP
ncbi:MAG: RMD1 family protein, partial [Bdellovibrionales bacterium]|nr:RMD1 family protein [Bdellovibrionales bacterium]